MLPQGQRRNCIPQVADIVPLLAAELGNPDDPGFEDLKVLWRAAEPWHRERPEETATEEIALVAVEAPGWVTQRR